ncbi:hypothetical protein HanXRQr2_Chr14g0620531 [Helianthus annuus]|uniref:Uncharacterized protein n=1 Tax=Helianthus annuus TaxID=4232 RepID=A0A9K3H5H6_HELAN|nr:hypothetical protein HanXRQr2_Chr14g0620531 [Helianthus annuus]
MCFVWKKGAKERGRRHTLSSSNRIPVDLSSASASPPFGRLFRLPLSSSFRAFGINTWLSGYKLFQERYLAPCTLPLALSSSSDSPLDSAVGIVVWNLQFLKHL